MLYFFENKFFSILLFSYCCGDCFWFVFYERFFKVGNYFYCFCLIGIFCNEVNEIEGFFDSSCVYGGFNFWIFNLNGRNFFFIGWDFFFLEKCRFIELV